MWEQTPDIPDTFQAWKLDTPIGYHCGPAKVATCHPRKSINSGEQTGSRSVSLRRSTSSHRPSLKIEAEETEERSLKKKPEASQTASTDYDRPQEGDHRRRSSPRPGGSDRRRPRGSSYRRPRGSRPQPQRNDRRRPRREAIVDRGEFILDRRLSYLIRTHWRRNRLYGRQNRPCRVDFVASVYEAYG